MSMFFEDVITAKEFILGDISGGSVWATTKKLGRAGVIGLSGSNLVYHNGTKWLTLTGT